MLSFLIPAIPIAEMGFGEKSKVCRGKPANQSIMVVKFSATFSGLQEAERLHSFYSKSKHGRTEFHHFDNSTGETPPEASSKVKHVLYGHLGLVEDLHKLDFETKKRCLVKSKREILNIADARLETE